MFLTEMSTYPLVVAQYRIEGHPRRTKHWSLVAIVSKGDACIYELVGSYDSFAYKPQKVNGFGRSRRLRGGCKVGEIPANSETKLQDVRVVRNNPDFDCQTWVMNAI